MRLKLGDINLGEFDTILSLVKKVAKHVREFQCGLHMVQLAVLSTLAHCAFELQIACGAK